MLQCLGVSLGIESDGGDKQASAMFVVLLLMLFLKLRFCTARRGNILQV